MASSTSSCLLVRDGLEPLVVVVDGDREHLLRAFLADHVLIEDVEDFVRLGQMARGRAGGFSSSSSRMMSLQSSTHSSQMNTRRAGDQLAHLVLALAAERAVKDLAAVARSALPVVAHSLASLRRTIAHAARPK